MRVRENRLAASAIVALMLALALVFASGCTSDSEQESDAAAAEQGGDEGATAEDEDVGGSGDDGSSAVEAGTLSWVDIELTDVKTGETFRVSDFSGEQVLVESFAVW